MTRLFRRAGELARERVRGEMARRLPRPVDRVRPAVEFESAELYAVELMAAQCRLSVASFLRVVAIDAAAHPERMAAWQAIADRLSAVPKGRNKPGRPRKSD